MSIKSLALLVTVAVSPINAFVVPPSVPSFVTKTTSTPMTTLASTTTSNNEQESSTILFSKTQLQYRNQDEEDFLYTDNTVAMEAASTSVAAPRKIFLPQAALESAEKKKVAEMMDTELIVGRVAMVSAIIMLTTEVMAGTSLPQQISNLLN